MLLTIYFNNKPLFIVDEKSKKIDELLHHEDTVFIDEFNSHTVKAMIHEMEAPQIHAGVFLHENIENVLHAFKKKMVLIQAAGGMVYTRDKEILLIYRRGKWDLPKGKLDSGEDLETCAVREVMEETGIKNLSIEKPIGLSYHTYHENGKRILKESHWFLLNAEKQEFSPQTEEEIEKCEWVAIGELSQYLENTHASIEEVIYKGINILKETGQAN